jgi:hypothetical protein
MASNAKITKEFSLECCWITCIADTNAQPLLFVHLVRGGVPMRSGRDAEFMRAQG